MTIQAINTKTVDTIKTGWPEFCFIVLITTGFFAFAVTMVITIGQLTGVHTEVRTIPVFSSFSPRFIISSAIFLLAQYLAYVPFYYGIRWFYYQAACGTIMPLASLFSCYSSWKVIKRCLYMKFRTDLAGLIRLLPGTVLIGGTLYGICSFYGNEDPFNHPQAVFVITVVTIAALILSFFLCIDIMYVPFIFTMDINVPASDVLKTSRRIVSISGYTIPKLCASTLPVLLIAPFVFPMMFFIPFFNFSMAVSLKGTIDEQE